MTQQNNTSQSQWQWKPGDDLVNARRIARDWHREYKAKQRKLAEMLNQFRQL